MRPCEHWMKIQGLSVGPSKRYATKYSDLVKWINE
jgi:hypothetical protein